MITSPALPNFHQTLTQALGSVNSDSSLTSTWAVRLKERVTLAALLSFSTPNKSNESAAEKLLDQYGSLVQVLSQAANIQSHSTIPPDFLSILGVVYNALTRSLRVRVESRPFIGNYNILRDYLHFSLGSAELEQVRVLFLNSKNILISDELHSTGSVSRVSVYVREIAKRALILNSTALVIAHNHPSGDVTPSIDDTAICKKIMIALDALDIKLHDNIIVGSGGFYSFREKGMLSKI